MTSVATVPIWLDERGTAWVDDTNTRVLDIVLDKLAYGWSPEEMHHQHPHLSLAQIHAALSYYHAHQQEMDAEIARDEGEVERLRKEAEAGQAPLRQRLLDRQSH